MMWVNAGIRRFLLAQGSAVRWLREELESQNVGIPLTNGCIEQLAREADRLARRAAGGGGRASYLRLLREQLIVQVRWVRRWTTTDDKPPADDPVAQTFVRIARTFALPRPWKLSEPVAVEVVRQRPAWTWATGLHAPAAAH